MHIIFKTIVAALCLLPGMLCAQQAGTPAAEWETLFRNLRPAERKALIDNSVETWNSGFLPASEKDSLEAVYKALRALPVSVDPELKNFLTCVNAFRMKDEKDNLSVWMGELKRLLASTDRKRFNIRNYLVTTTPIVCDQILSGSGSHQWKVYGQGHWTASPDLRIDYEQADLVCKSSKDSAMICGTAFRFRLGENEITGNGGTVKWRESDTMSASLSGYKINTRMSEYVADSVLFHYTGKFGRPILGKLRDNVSQYTRAGLPPYPEFTSYDMDIDVGQLFPDVSYRGGILYSGRKFTGIGNEQHLATVHISLGDTVNVNICSKHFNVDSVRILAGSAAVHILMDSGEINHPDINFFYDDRRRTVDVKRITEQSQHLPFRDTYHRILLNVDEIIWPLDSNRMEMRMGSRSGLLKATIESLNFFNDVVYDNIQGMDEINPLNGLLKCSAECGSPVFTVGRYAEFIKKPADQLRKQIVLLSFGDFVDYNELHDEVTLKQRLFDYTRARVGKQDYDNIRFTSHPQGSRTNAVLDMQNYNLKIMGVDRFTISEAKDVYVEPSDRTVVMMKNRDMLFDGKLKAGMFDMYGAKLFFSYDSYSVKLANMDSTSMYLAGKESKMRGEKIRSLIRGLEGDIVIDRPDNKSGKKELEGFPELNSSKESYVYFDDPVIQDGKYGRDSFYYVIKPYKMRGINDTRKFNYAFDGTLVSNILPPVRDSLRLMKDHMLGMDYKTPPSGVELYGSGRLRSKVVLDGKGLVAGGDVEMNGSRFSSDTILLLPKLLTANTKHVEVAAVASARPGARGDGVKVEYLVKGGCLRLASTAKPFDLYAGQVRHSGVLSVYAKTMDASGRLELKDAELSSGLFRLQSANILSDHTSLKIASMENQNMQLNTGNVRADIDLVAQKGKFINNAEANRVEFLGCGYSCTFRSFTWYMQDAYLNIGIEDEKELARIWKMEDVTLIPEQGRNLFLASARASDSLNFVAPLAKYDLKSGNIDCRWVNHIDVANGRFYPGGGNIFIEAQKGIREFTDGRLLCERSDSSRVLTGVTFNILGKNNFSGSGDYAYVSEEGKTTPIRFAEVGTDTARLIRAKAVITEENPLYLNNGFRYQGTIFLYSRQKNLCFKGYVGLTAGREYLKHSWLAVNSYLDPRHIVVPVQTENSDNKKQRIYNGFFLNVDKTIRPYASFMSSRLFYNDDLLMGGKGDMIWSGALKQYVIRDTVTDRNYEFRYDTVKYTLSASGRLNLKQGLPGIVQQAAGNISFNLKDERLDIKDVLYGIDFRLLPKMEAMLLKEFQDKKRKNVAMTSRLTEKIYSICGKEQIPVVSKQLAHPADNLPDSLNHFLVLDSLNFTWNSKTRSYVSDGDVKLLAMRNKPVGKVMKIKMELVRKRSGNEFFIYLYDDTKWYYFEYSGKALYALSSNTEYNETLKLEKADKKEVMNENKELLYTITLCPESKKESFLKRMK